MPAPQTDVLYRHSSIRDLQAELRARTGAGSRSPPGEPQAAHLASPSPLHPQGDPLHLSWPAPSLHSPAPRLRSPAPPRESRPPPRLHSPCSSPPPLPGSGPPLAFTVLAPSLRRPAPYCARPSPCTPRTLPSAAPRLGLRPSPCRPGLRTQAPPPPCSYAPRSATLRPHRPAHLEPRGLRVPPGRLRSPPFFPPAYQRERRRAR